MIRNKKFSIYAIQCTENKKIYIGRTQQTIKERIIVHLQSLRSGRHTNKELQSDFNKYGENCFEFYELESEIPYEDRFKEKEYMEKYKSYESKYGYNTKDQYFKGDNREIVIIKDRKPETQKEKEE